MVLEKAPATPGAKRRSRSKSLKKVNKLTPFEERLKDSETYTRRHLEEFSRCGNIKARLELVHSLLGEDVTDVSRAWPLALKTKDSRLRRQLSGRGKDAFLQGDHAASLEHYNQALMYSTGKGIAHTLAMRAAFFLATDEHALAVRDLSIALEYGCLETELLDFLMMLHTEDEEAARKREENKMDTAIETMRNAKCDMQNASAADIAKWADDIRQNLTKALKMKQGPGSKKVKDDILKNIIQTIKNASEESKLDENLEIQELEVPKMKEKNPLCPAFSEATKVTADPDKGRKVVARRDIKAGEMLCVDDPVCSMLCPDDKKSVTSHCINCFRFTRAPLPCDTCCSVVFCSKKCKLLAIQGFHKYECQLKLYEMFEHEKPEIFSLFMALRAITQKPVQYFTENQNEIEKFLELDEPKFPFPGRAYNSEDYRALANLMTHVNDLEEHVLMKNSVLSVFFLRFLKSSGYFGRATEATPRGGRGGEKPLGGFEVFILRLIHQIICAQVYNAQPVHKITKAFTWEKVGSAINPSLALVNHSCDSNALRCSVNKSSILVAAEHIREGEEITESYTVHFRDSDLNTRHYHTLKNYMFQCECSACTKNWPMEGEVREERPNTVHEIYDELHAVPSMSQEKAFKVTFGDKKKCVHQIVRERKVVEKWMVQKRFGEALEAYQDLCKSLEEHVRKPHTYYLQVRSGIAHTIWNLYCTQFPEKPTDEFDESNRDLAKEIYKNNLTEDIPVESELMVPNSDDGNGDEVMKPSEEEIEKAALMEATKKLLAENSQKVAEAREGTEALKLESEEAKQAHLELMNAQKETANGHALQDKVNAPQDEVNTNTTKIVDQQIELEAAEQAAKRGREKILSEKEKQERLSRRKQWEAEENERKSREMARKKKRELETEERIKREKEKEKLRKDILKAEEEEKRIQREIEYEEKKKKEDEQRQEEVKKKQRQKQEEEDELAILLAEIGDAFEPCDSALDQLEADHGKPPFKAERGKEDIAWVDMASTSVLNGKNETNSSISIANGGHPMDHHNNSGPHSSNSGNSQNSMNNVSCDSLDSNTHNNMNGINHGDSHNNETKPDESVWAALRKIKEAKNTWPSVLEEKTQKETLSLDQFDCLITNLSNMVKEPQPPKKLEQLEEECEEVTGVDTNVQEQSSKCSAGTTEDVPDNILDSFPQKEFNYESWKAEIDGIFGGDEPVTVEPTAADDLYLQKLKAKIALSTEKQSKQLKEEEKQSAKEKKAVTPSATPTMPRKQDDFVMLKLKEKERKKRKNEEKFNQKVSENTDKLKEVTIKTAKIEKISTETENELQKLREKSKLLVQRSTAQESEFDEIFKNIDNIDQIILESEKTKKGKKGSKKQEELCAMIAKKNELHWTEEDRGKWDSKADKTSHSKVSDLLSTMKAMACQGNADILDTIKTSISHCQKVDAENKADTLRMKEEKRKQAQVKEQKGEVSKTIQKKDKQQETVNTVDMASIKVGSQHKEEDEDEEEEERKILELEKQLELRKQEEERMLEEEEDRMIMELERKAEKRKQEEEVFLMKLKSEEEEKKKIENKKKAEVEVAKKEAEKAETRKKEMQEAKLKMEIEKKRQEAEANELKKKIAEEKIKQVEEEKIKKKAEEDERKKVKEAKLRKAEEAKKQKQVEELERKRAEEEKIQKAKMQRKAEEDNKRKEEEEKLKKIEEQKLKRAEENKKRMAEEEVLKKIEEDKKAEEEKIKRIEEERLKIIEEEKEAEERRKMAEDARLRNIEEEKRQRKAEEERKKTEAEKIKRIEEEQIKKIKDNKEAENKRKMAEDEEEERIKKVKEEREKEYVMKNDELKRIEIMKSKEVETIRSIAKEKQKIEDEAEESLQQIKAIKKQFSSGHERNSIETSVSKNVNPVKVVSVSPNSFMPQKNTKEEIGVIKMGSPSQIRRAVKLEVKNEESDPSSRNYQITTVPTTSFEVKKPLTSSEKEKKYSITKVPTSTVILEQMTKTYAENVVKYSETKPTDNRSRSVSKTRPPPPASKPPPPPPLFKPPPPPPLW